MCCCAVTPREKGRRQRAEAGLGPVLKNDFLPFHPSLSSGLLARSVPRGRCSFFLVFARVSLARARGLFSLPALFSFLALFCLSCLSVCWQLDFKTTYIFLREKRCRNSRFIRVWRAFGQVGTWECQKTKLLGSAAHAYLGSSTNCFGSSHLSTFCHVSG